MTPSRRNLVSSETFGEITLERILARGNLMQALKKVEANKGSCGVDGMETSELRAYFKSNPLGNLQSKFFKVLLSPRL